MFLLKQAPIILAAFLALLTSCASPRAHVSADGSTSMENAIGILGEVYENEHENVKFTYNPTGSGSGIAAVAEGRCDIGLSSRKLTDAEKSIGLSESLLAYDAIAVIVNPENPISDLPLQSLKKIFSGEIRSWDELSDLHGETVVIGREAGSGTREGFEEAAGLAGECIYRRELTSSGDIIASVSQNRLAIGYVSLPTVKENVKVLSVNGVLPDSESVRDGSYPLFRPFFLITSKHWPLTDDALGFFNFALSEASGEYLSRAGVIPAH